MWMCNLLTCSMQKSFRSIKVMIAISGTISNLYHPFSFRPTKGVVWLFHQIGAETQSLNSKIKLA